MMVLILIVVAVSFGPIIAIGLWLAHLATAGGDRLDDATTRIELDADGEWLAVSNPSDVPVLVAAATRTQRPLAGLFQPPDLVKRPARRSERSRRRAWAPSMLGAVPPGAQMRWPLPVSPVRARLMVTLAQPGDRLRVHDHLILPLTLSP
jgi:hypothetical protein